MRLPDTQITAALDQIGPPFAAAMGFPLEPHLAGLVQAGSATYNLQLDAQTAGYVPDVDLFAVVLPPVERTLGLDPVKTWVYQEGEIDITIVSVAKYMEHLTKLNPSMLQPLWVRPEHVLRSTEAWESLRASRQLFASRDIAKSYGQYARSQLAVMELFDDATAAEWEAARALIARAGWSLDSVVLHGGRPMPLDPTLSTAELEAACVTLRRIHARHFQGYMGAKRKKLVTTHGFDVRQASHVLRLARQGREFLETGTLTVWRDDDAAQLRAVKAGQVSLEDVKDLARRELDALEKAVPHSPLPDSLDRRAINTFMGTLQLTGLQRLQTAGSLGATAPLEWRPRDPKPSPPARRR